VHLEIARGGREALERILLYASEPALKPGKTTVKLCTHVCAQARRLVTAFLRMPTTFNRCKG
jgi:hypothetical protein